MNVLEIDSRRWRELHHAYGPANDTPELLRKLSDGDRDALSNLFGSINHQCSVYSASFAAVPHLVQIADRLAEGTLKAETLCLVGSICSGSGPRDVESLPTDRRIWYEAALERALPIATESLARVADRALAIHLLEATAGIAGYRHAGRVLSGFASEEFAPTCPRCEVQLYVWPSDDLLTVTADDPVSSPPSVRRATTRGPAFDSDLRGMFDWLYEHSSSRPLRSVQRLLPYLFGDATCPACGRTFNLMARLLDEFPADGD